MLEQEKLVRDKYKDIFDKEWVWYKFCPKEELVERLMTKLDEEVGEFEEDRSKEELADVLEVIYALAKEIWSSFEEIESMRVEKSQEKGWFEKGLIWSGERKE